MSACSQIRKAQPCCCHNDHSRPFFAPTPIRAPAQYYSPSIRKKYGTEPDTNPYPPSQNTEFADIGYAFDERKYAERTAGRLRAGGLPTSVPAGWPTALQGPLVWTGSDFPDESVFVYDLTDGDKEEIANALSHFKSLDIEGRHVSASLFPLPGLQEKLLRIRDDVYQGHGFCRTPGS